MNKLSRRKHGLYGTVSNETSLFCVKSFDSRNPKVSSIASMPFQIFVAPLSGIIAHQGVFIRGEWHLRAPAVVLVHAALLVLIGSTKALKYPSEGHHSTQTAIQLFFGYLGVLFGTVTIYRLYFHRLRHFPSPRLAAISTSFGISMNVETRESFGAPVNAPKIWHVRANW